MSTTEKRDIITTWLRFRRGEDTLPLTEHCSNLGTLLGLEQENPSAFRELLRLIPWNEHDALFSALDGLEPGGRPCRVSLSFLRSDMSTLRLRGLIRLEADGVYTALLEEWTSPEKKTECRVRIRTFGFFDIFIDGKALAFNHAKSKELLALLVDRQGGFVTSAEAVSYLWEDESADRLTLSRYRKVAMRLKDTLEQYGIGDIIENRNGSRRLVPERVSCDLYDYLAHRSESDSFKGYYMSNYSWAEPTLAQLLNEKE